MKTAYSPFLSRFSVEITLFSSTLPPSMLVQGSNRCSTEPAQQNSEEKRNHLRMEERPPRDIAKERTKATARTGSRGSQFRLLQKDCDLLPV